MSNPNRRNRFLFGAAAGVLLFLAANAVAAHLASDCGLGAVLGLARCADDIRRAGFPLIFWEQGGFAPRNLFSLAALLIDAGIGLAVSLGAGWAASRASA